MIVKIKIGASFNIIKRTGSKNSKRRIKIMQNYSLKDLEFWDNRIKEIAENFGLNFFETEFEICDYEQMLGYLAYNGMPSHYPHWSFGKAFEKQRTLYNYGLTGLPYEMVINSDPCLAYLMRDNSIVLQILTMAHVYAHNDFFRNNKTFKFSNPKYTIEMFKSHSQRIREYCSDPSIGLEEVEKLLDAGHSLALHAKKYFDIRNLSPSEQKQRLIEKMSPKKDEFSHLKTREEAEKIDLYKVPLEPEEDLLLFIRNNNPYLKNWQRDILTIVAQETEYFIPQMETKIINEGWASYWHYKILETLEMEQGFYFEFLTHHNKVIQKLPGRINPYRLGLEIYKDIEKRFGEKDKKRIFLAREVDRDESFLRQYLTEKLMREMNFFSHEQHGSGNDREISDISDEEGWKKVKEVIIKNTGLNSIPVIKIEDANYKKERVLYLKHYYDGRGLELSYAQQTLKYLFFLWQKRVILESWLEEKPVYLSYDGTDTVKVTYQLLT